MLEARELRLGNLIEYNNNGTPVKVQNILGHRVEYNDGCYSDYKSMTPIPLTEEWLIRLGFSKMITQDNTYLIPIGVEFGLDSIDILFKIDTGMIYKGTLEDPVLFPINNVKIEFVHHLQNAIFENFREELTDKQQ